MRIPRILLILAVIGGIGAALASPARRYLKTRNQVQYRFAEVVRGPIVSVVNSTGTVKPVLSVLIGSFVSGPIKELYVDFNDEVKKGDLLAKIDPLIYQAAVARDAALLATRKADVERVKAELQRAINDQTRSVNLRKQNPGYISDSEMDQYKFAKMALQAQLQVAQTAVEQAKASLESSQANLAYTEIRSPVDGIVIDRKIDPGQTLAAQFQTPEMFIIAPNLREEVHVFASVDEADIGMVRDAQQADRPVRFTVDAYPDELFEGHIAQIRMSSTTVQNVVTYPVVVSAPNPDLKLLPGMTASLSFEIDSRDNTIKIPNAALWFYPALEQVHPDDRDLLEGASESPEEPAPGAMTLPAAAKAEANRQQIQRHVWVLEGNYLRAIEVVVGLMDHQYTELIEGALQVGQKLVTGIDPRR